MKVHIFDKKQVLYVVLAIMLLCIGMVCALRAVNRLGAAEAAAGITDWGLSFQSEGAPPVANASQEYLRNFDALYVGDTNQKEIYITAPRREFWTRSKTRRKGNVLPRRQLF